MINSKDEEMLPYKDIFIGAEGKVYRSAISKIEEQVIKQALEKTGGNRLKAAKILGINRNTLHSKIKKLGIEVNK